MHELRQESPSTHSKEHLKPWYCPLLTDELIHWLGPFSQSTVYQNNTTVNFLTVDTFTRCTVSKTPQLRTFISFKLA